MKMFRFVLFVFLCVIPLCASARKYYDAAAFDLVGHVRYMLTSTGRISFKEDGSLDKANSTALSEYKKYAISRSKDGYPVKIVTDFETILLEYDDTHKLTKKTVRGTSNYTITYYREYSKILNWQKETFMMLDGSRKSDVKKYSVSIDSRNNWISRNELEAPETEKEERFMAYWTSRKYERGESEIDIFSTLSAPLEIEGFDKMQLKDIKWELKARKLKYKSYLSHYTITNYGKTYYGYNVTPEFHCLKKKSTPSDFSIIVNLPMRIGEHYEDIVAFMINEATERGYEVKFDRVPYFMYNGYCCRLFRHYNYSVRLEISFRKY
ncbi:MAG: hypothetical protein IJX41_02200 [Bacteroidaceae bacterium]|nr:hypothetical protein [Bacteroidaceae bacterium]